MKQVLRKILSSAIMLAALACGKDPFPGGGESDLEPVPPPDTLVTPGPDTSTARKFFFGANGHPVTQAAYKALSAKEQLELIKSLGFNIYRIDIAVDENGYSKMHNRLMEFCRLADEMGIVLLPMLYHVQMDFDGFEQDSYESGYQRGRNFAAIYKDYFKYYNIANELDNRCILPKMSGTLSSHYDLKKFKIIAAHLKGMNDGIKSIDSEAETMVNASWMHYRYLLMLEDYGVNYDVVAYHWYDEMDKLAAKTYNIDDITQFLCTKFSKPIWFTEVNIRNTMGNVADDVQSAFLNKMYMKCKSNPQVKAMMVYELFNQPVFNSIESHYGLFTWTQRYKQYQPKLWAEEQIQRIAFSIP
ncbi:MULTISPECIES: glycosyl hydrolase [Olivibacter]|jgi:hypothetical protein|uniref:Glycosyl hydrolase n=1 Tax=Olivibacter oleidegradans TaxID=760123 RepID=A0ABV6HIX4_9SPHI|nr:MULTISPECIES: glycosyl hydrolase [Olivibacter]MDM8176704.1 glycosyl hydrolase [Olivibacter sp. 47]QEL00527.1 hypothetical protein FKG96_06790 [Olivibacter sp. LS-1]